MKETRSVLMCVCERERERMTLKKCTSVLFYYSRLSFDKMVIILQAYATEVSMYFLFFFLTF